MQRMNYVSASSTCTRQTYMDIHVAKIPISPTDTVFAVISAPGTYKIIQTDEIQIPHN